MLVTCDLVHFDEFTARRRRAETEASVMPVTIHFAISSLGAVTSDIIRFDGVQRPCDK